MMTRYEVQQLGPGYFAVLDTVTKRHVFAALDYVDNKLVALIGQANVPGANTLTSSERAHNRAAELNNNRGETP